MPFRFVHELEEHIIDGATDKCAQIEEFAVNPMQRCLQEITLARVFAVEELQQLYAQISQT